MKYVRKFTPIADLDGNKIYYSKIRSVGLDENNGWTVGFPKGFNLKITEETGRIIEAYIEKRLRKIGSITNEVAFKVGDKVQLK